MIFSDKSKMKTHELVEGIIELTTMHSGEPALHIREICAELKERFSAEAWYSIRIPPRNYKKKGLAKGATV